jgi:hypothetical protein
MTCTDATEALKQSLLTPTSTDPFAVAYLQLCQVSYFLPISTIAPAVPNLPPLNTGGSWQCVWGPVQSPDEANVVYVAVYNYGPGMPVFAAVVIRGTDVDVSDPWGVIEQIWEDADVLAWGPMPWDPTQPARIANGSLYALSLIQGLTSGGLSLQSFLASFLSDPANNDPVLVVTGHSLGGGLVPVVASWLRSALASSGVNNPIVPTSFAAPTPGDAAFADYYDATFRYAPRYWNTLDVVPRGWWDLSGVTTIYDGCNLPIPDVPYYAILGWEGAMYLAGVSYAQQRTNNAPLAGACLVTTDWYAQLGYQHHTTTYMSLLGGTSIVPPPESFAPTGRVSRRSTAYARFGPAAAALRRR